MRVPQVSDRIKEVPAQALRGVFAGIGQVLLITDRLRNKTPAHQQVPQARTPERSETAAVTTAEPVPEAPRAEKAAPAAPASPADRAGGFDRTGNVRLLGGSRTGASDVAKITHVAEPAEATAVTEEAAEADVTASGAEADVTASAADVEVEAGVAAEVAAPAAEVEAGAPLPNYDELTIASLRARLRNLDAGQVKELAEYERAHAGRADVIAMFERRIAKLEADD